MNHRAKTMREMLTNVQGDLSLAREELRYATHAHFAQAVSHTLSALKGIREASAAHSEAETELSQAYVAMGRHVADLKRQAKTLKTRGNQ